MKPKPKIPPEIQPDPIPLPERHHVDAAVGWLMLGSARDASEELARLPKAVAQRLEVLELRWETHSGLRDWEEAFRVATLQVTLFPDAVSGWLHRAYAARRMARGGVAQAAAYLGPAAARFPMEPLVRYNLACYSAVQGDPETAWIWFCKALAVGQPVELRRMALADPDLEPIWPRIAVEA